jgi:hypothetical protein
MVGRFKPGRVVLNVRIRCEKRPFIKLPMERLPGWKEAYEQIGGLNNGGPERLRPNLWMIWCLNIWMSCFLDLVL